VRWTSRAIRKHAPTGAIYRQEAHRIFATLMRLPDNFDLAETAWHDTFRALDITASIFC
jgi:predicted RNA polymerase sigma factor